VADEPFVSVWREYAVDVQAAKDIRVLRDRLVQLSFPVKEGISAMPEYLAATRRGLPPPQDGILALERPDLCRLFLHETSAGTVPVISVARRADFVALVRVFTMRGEPCHVPDSQGACIVGGYNNWDRVARFRRSWSEAHPRQTFTLAGLAALKQEYQDCFLILSEGYYSGVAPESVGLEETAWLRTSFLIRLDHECAHYWTRRVLRSMRNCVIDELLADYCGLLAAVGRYREDWAARFFGLESYPRFRDTGRLANYRGNPPLSDAAFSVLQALTVRAIRNLGEFDRRHSNMIGYPTGIPLVLLTLTKFTLEELAAESRLEMIAEEFSRTTHPVA
jgi:hypothetical protein